MLCTLLAPTGRPGRRWPATTSPPSPAQVRLRIGAALQEAALDPKQTGAELLRLQGLLYGLPKSAIDGPRRRAGRAHRPQRRPRPAASAPTPGGMQRRLDLAAALVHNPEILFLDEPTTGLDPVSRASVWDEVRRLNRELGMTIFLTTQYLEEADELADRVGIIDRGRIVAEGTPGRAQAHGRHRRDRRPDRRRRRRRVPDRRGACRACRASRRAATSWSSPPTTARPPSAPWPSRSRAARSTVRDLTLRTPTLDDVFLELTGTRIERDDDRSDVRRRPRRPRSGRRHDDHRCRPGVGRRAPGPARPASSTTSPPSPGGRCGPCPATSRRSSRRCSSPCSSSS